MFVEDEKAGTNMRIMRETVPFRPLHFVIIMWWCASVYGNRGVSYCRLPDCKDITVDPEKTRDVFVTSCRLNRVFVMGDAHNVRVHSLNQRGSNLCGK